jgi:predicted Fe-S protein YdhL (DUF1289 family)
MTKSRHRQYRLDAIRMSKNKSKSPCIGICKIDKKNGLCKGCLRTRQEIKGWKALSKSERREITGEIVLRKREARAA